MTWRLLLVVIGFGLLVYGLCLIAVGGIAV